MVELGAQTIIREPGECIVRVDGTELTELYPHLRSVEVEMDRQGAAVCTLEFETFREEGEHWRVQDSELLEPWKPIVIEAVFGDRTDEVMRGYIREINVDCPQEMGEASVTVSGQDESILLDREHVRQLLSEEDAPQSDGDLASRVASDNGFDARVEAGLTNRNLHQDATHVRFLRDRAEANGFELFVREGTLHFHPPELDGDPQPTIYVYGGAETSCLNISIQHDGHRPDRIGVTRAADTGEDLEETEVIPTLSLLGERSADSESSGLTPFLWRMEQPAGATLEEAQTRAQARANESAWKIRASGELDGIIYGHVLLTHQTVRVEGIGETYSGLYYVDSVKHTFDADGYRQQFRLLRNATG
jgi:phage protein D